MSDRIVYTNAADFEADVLAHDGPVAVDFYSTECPPCEALAPKFEGLAELYGDDIKFVKIFRQENRELSEQLGITGSPTVIFYDRGERVGPFLTGGILRSELEAALRDFVTPERAATIDALKVPSETECDVLVIGAGPAGLTAGIYAAQAKLNTICVDRALAGGNLNITHKVSNFPGFPEPQPGWMLAHLMRSHAEAAGVTFREAVEVTDLDLEGHVAVIDGLETIRAKKIIVATGSSPRALGVEGEQEYRGRGISYCATCDAKHYQDKHVVVIGGGNSAIEESLFIAKFAKKITIVHQFDKLQANQSAQERAFAEPKIEFVFHHEPRAFIADGDTVNQVRVENLETGEQHVIACDGVFIFAGMKPNLELVDGVFYLDDFGYVRVDEDMHTNVADVFVIGDLASKKYRQMTTAVSDGTVAAMALTRELAA